MNCESTNTTTNNFIKESVTKIDKIQKDILSDSFGTCITCQTSLLAVNNTIPVRFFTCCGNPILGNLGVAGGETVFFRIEAIRANRFVTLRLLTLTGETLAGSDYTMILDLDCVGSMQCFEAISVEVCTQSSAI